MTGHGSPAGTRSDRSDPRPPAAPYSGALAGLVADGTLTEGQAAAVSARIAATRPAPAASRWLAETAGYLGGALMFAGAALLIGVSWDELSRLGRIVVLAAATSVLAAAGAVTAGGLGGWWVPPATTAASTMRRRLASVLWAVAASNGGLTAGVAVETAATGEHSPLVGGVVGLMLAVTGYALLPSVPLLLAAGALTTVTSFALAGDLLGGTPLATGGTLVAAGATWAGLALLGRIRHRGIAVAVGAVVALVGAQLPLEGHPGWAYLLTVLVAAGCLAGYALTRGAALLAIGVLATTMVASEAVADWTNGAAGGAIAVLVAGAALVLGSLLALRLYRRAPGHASRRRRTGRAPGISRWRLPDR